MRKIQIFLKKFLLLIESFASQMVSTHDDIYFMNVSNKYFTATLTSLINTFISLKDKLGLRSTEEREQILSKLYEIQHPSGPTVAEILKEPFPKSKISHPRSSRESKSLSGGEGHNHRSTHSDITPHLHVWHDLSGKLKFKHSLFSL